MPDPQQPGTARPPRPSPTRLGRIRSGLAAIALAWLLGLAAWLLCIGLGQVIFYIALRGWPFDRPGPGLSLVVAVGVALTALLLWLLPLLATALGLSGVDELGWTAQVTLNALSTVVILHVAVWGRWPVRDRSPA